MDKLNKYLRRLKDHIANAVGGDSNIDPQKTNDKTQKFQKIFKTEGVTMFNSQKRKFKVNIKLVLSIMLMALCLFVMPQNAYVAAEEETVAEIEKTVTVFKEEQEAAKNEAEYLVKDFNGKVSVFKDGDFQYSLDIYTFTLPKEDKNLLSQGIKASSQQEINDILSCYY